MHALQHTLDVREDLRQGRAPFDRILAAATGLGAGEVLRVIAPFEPVPLLTALARRGFAHQSSQTADGDWEVDFIRNPPEASTPAAADAVEPTAPGVFELDARGLEPPGPMVRVLEASAALPAGAELRARTDRRPIHLLDELEVRGFNHHSEEQTDGSHVTCIRRA